MTPVISAITPRGQQHAQRHSELRIRSGATMFVVVSVFDGEQCRATPFAARGESLHDPQKDEQDRGRDADRLVRGEKTDERCCHAHRHQSDDKDESAAQLVTEVARQERSERSEQEKDPDRRKREHLSRKIDRPISQRLIESESRARHQIVETTQDRLTGNLETGEIDAAFVYETLILGTPNHALLVAQPAHVILAADDPFADRPAVRLEDLVKRDMILLDSPPSSQHTLSMFHDRDLQPIIRHRTTSYEVVRTLVARGLGYGVLVQRLNNTASYEGYPLVVKEIEPAVEAVRVEAIWPSGVAVAERVRSLIEFSLETDWATAKANDDI